MCYKQEWLNIYNTRYIWTIAHILYLDDEYDSSTIYKMIYSLGYNHGMRDCDTFFSNGTNYADNNEIIKNKEPIIEFLLKQIKMEVLDIKYAGTNDKLEIILKNSIFIPKPELNNDSILTENKNFYTTGYYYTVSYLDGFFYRLKYIKNRNKVSGVYEGGIAARCYLNYVNDMGNISFILNMIDHTNETAINNDLKKYELNENDLFKMAKNGSDKKPFSISNTRYIWSLKYLTDDSIEGCDKNLIKIGFSHGIRDYKTFTEGTLTIKDYLESIEFFKIVKIEEDTPFNSALLGKSQDVFIRIAISNSILIYQPVNARSLWEKMTTDEQTGFRNFDDFDFERKEEDKKLNKIGFLYTKHYLRGFFHGKFIGCVKETKTIYAGALDSNLFCYYEGESNGILTFTIATDTANTICDEKPCGNRNQEFNNKFLL